MKIATRRTGRPFWTQERVRRGLLRFFSDTGLAPTSKHTYHSIVSALDLWKKGARRRYPPFYQLLFWWPSMRDAWIAAGVESPERAAATEQLKAWGLPVNRRVNRLGERYGSLVVEALASYEVREYKARSVRVILWRCICDCGRERVVEAGRLGSARPVTRCLVCARARTDAAGAASLARLRAAGVVTRS